MRAGEHGRKKNNIVKNTDAGVTSDARADMFRDIDSWLIREQVDPRASLAGVPRTSRDESAKDGSRLARRFPPRSINSSRKLLRRGARRDRDHEIPSRLLSRLNVACDVKLRDRIQFRANVRVNARAEIQTFHITRF